MRIILTSTAIVHLVRCTVQIALRQVVDSFYRRTMVVDNKQPATLVCPRRMNDFSNGTSASHCGSLREHGSSLLSTGRWLVEQRKAVGTGARLIREPGICR